MPLRLRMSNHMQDMMQFRGIEIDHVRQAINKPDLTEPAYNDKILVRKKIDEEKTIEVIYRKDGFRDTNDIILITAYYLTD